VVNLWYVARATGMVSLLLLTATAVLGVLGPMRVGSAGWPRFALAGLHRNISLLTLTFLGVHVVAVTVDSYVPISWLDPVVPFVSAYQPLWVGLGAVAFDLLLALVATSLLRSRIDPRLWRAVHWLAYACWPVALAHALGGGTDAATGWPLGVGVACAAAVLAAAGWRLARRVVSGGRRTADGRAS
jgi:predicted ferric reductase